MTTITAKVIADSISVHNRRITTLELRFPRIILPEFNTHRIFSRSASSSRAVPIERMMDDIRADPFVPLFWGSNKPGMQAGDEIDNKISAKAIWLAAMESALFTANRLNDLGLHKQTVNRILEPFSHISVLVTSTDFRHFLELRDHPAAEPHIQLLARNMKVALESSEPVLKTTGRWHTPYVSNDEIEGLGIDNAIKCSVARCARVSYLNHDGSNPDVSRDLNLYERLVSMQPPHASPLEHIAAPDFLINHDTEWGNRDLHGNFSGWIQFRKTIPNEFLKG